MIVDGSGYAYKRMQVGATATGDGNSMHPINVSSGSYALLTAQVVGISGDTITWEGTIDEENWVALPALNVAKGKIPALPPQKWAPWFSIRPTPLSRC